MLSPADQDSHRTLASHAAIALETLRTAEELRVAHDEALAASRAKDAFLKTVGHELRTPLTTILGGYTDMLREELAEAGDGDHAADAKSSHHAAADLLAIVSNVLELTELEVRPHERSVTSFAVADLLAELDAEIRPIAERTRNRLEVSVDASAGSVTCDRARLTKILRELLENACKFTKHARRRREAGESAPRAAVQSRSHARSVLRVARQRSHDLQVALLFGTHIVASQLILETGRDGKRVREDRWRRFPPAVREGLGQR